MNDGLMITGLRTHRVVVDEGDFVRVEEVWNPATSDCPFCLLPRGAPRTQLVKRVVPMYRSEAVKMGLIR